MNPRMTTEASDPDVDLIRNVLGVLVLRGTGQWPAQAQAAVAALDRIVRSRRNAIGTANRLRKNRDDDRLVAWEAKRQEPPD